MSSSTGDRKASRRLKRIHTLRWGVWVDSDQKDACDIAEGDEGPDNSSNSDIDPQADPHDKAKGVTDSSDIDPQADPRDKAKGVTDTCKANKTHPRATGPSTQVADKTVTRKTGPGESEHSGFASRPCNSKPSERFAQNKWPIPIGVTLDSKYRLRKVLGKGTSGVVYLADDIALERQVAVKVLLPEYAVNRSVAKCFHREAVAMARVRHNNVVQIYSFGEHLHLPYFVMEYIQGHTVATYLQQSKDSGQPLYLDVALGILKQVCNGLQAVHDNRIIHRDVKPANMLIGPLFRIAIADFGLVARVDQSLTMTRLTGTPLYLAPELLRNASIPAEQRHLIDIYALGISTFEMLAGEGPFKGESIPRILHCHLKQPPPRVTDFRSDLPSAFNAVIAKVMHKDPTKRYQSCMEFLEACNKARGKQDIKHLASPHQILVIDSNSEVYRSYTTVLKIGIPNSTITTIEDGATALEMIRDRQPDLILIDLDLQGENGIELCAQICKDSNAVPILAIISDKSERKLSLLHAMNVKGVLDKPVELVKLVNLARYLLEQ